MVRISAKRIVCSWPISHVAVIVHRDAGAVECCQAVVCVKSVRSAWRRVRVRQRAFEFPLYPPGVGPVQGVKRDGKLVGRSLYDVGQLAVSVIRHRAKRGVGVGHSRNMPS